MRMYWSPRILLCLGGLLLLCSNTPSVQAQEADLAKPLRFTVHYGSLAGTAIGVSYAMTRRYGLNLTLGVPPLDGGIGQPFPGNRVNVTMGIPLRVTPSVYLAPGFHAGYYRMKATDKNNLRLVEEIEIMILARPRIALGYEKDFMGGTRTLILEVGASFFIPDMITKDIQRGRRNWIFEAERGIDSAIYPSYMIGVKF